ERIWAEKAEAIKKKARERAKTRDNLTSEVTDTCPWASTIPSLDSSLPPCSKSSEVSQDPVITPTSELAKEKDDESVASSATDSIPDLEYVTDEEVEKMEQSKKNSCTEKFTFDDDFAFDEDDSSSNSEGQETHDYVIQAPNRSSIFHVEVDNIHNEPSNEPTGHALVEEIDSEESTIDFDEVD
ncbi:hypothetical protein ADUPG1_007201, partial [Aduncisulcus paluster]